MCFFAPGALVDPRLTWQPVDDRTATATFANGPHRVTATLHFNDRDELVDFTSDDRPAERQRHAPPAAAGRRRSRATEEIDGRRLPTRGSAVYAYPEGDFTYGAFTLRSIAYDLAYP